MKVLPGFLIIIASVFTSILAQSDDAVLELCKELKFDYPKHGFVSVRQATKWEESLITGNGTIGTLMHAHPQKDIIILSHEKLFLPEYPPTKAPKIGDHMDTIRELVLNGEGEKAADLAVKLGKDAGIDDFIWTDPLIPACQLEIEDLDSKTISKYAKSVNYETGETSVYYKTGEKQKSRSAFVSRDNGLAVLRVNSATNSELNFRFRLTQLPLAELEESEEFNVDEVISRVNRSAIGNLLYYSTEFKKTWKGSLKGYMVTAKVYNINGSIEIVDDWLNVSGAEEILVLMDIKLDHDLPLNSSSKLTSLTDPDYNEMLNKHKKIHGEMFNRFQLDLTPDEKKHVTAEDLRATSAPGKLNNALVEQICEAARYILICSTGEIPPTLQGIWGGTWRPAWSSDFTHNGNVPSVIASGFSGNFIEIMESYTDYMWSMFDDYKTNAREIYNSDGIFALSRTSSSGKTYHYISDYPHLFWFAGAAWTSQFFYDYWQYTCDTAFLKTKTIPYMLASIAFYEDILTKNDQGMYMFVPSYSPEIGPVGMHPVAINATMDVAALKQLLRNLITLAEQDWIEKSNISGWNEILQNLPEYEVDDSGDLKEWIFPGGKNNNTHRHASHLYPLYYEKDPDFINNQDLIDAAKTAIEKRMETRRMENGGVMAFGLTQLGLAAAHLPDSDLAYECVDWLCNSYWTSSFTSYHDPGRIFNVDICGGLPAVINEMLLQSSWGDIKLLPALPDEWSAGKVKGLRARGGFEIDMEWKNGKVIAASIYSTAGNPCRITFNNKTVDVEIKKGSRYTLLD